MDYRKIIKEIGRGKNHARDLDRDTARGLNTIVFKLRNHFTDFIDKTGLVCIKREYC